MSRGPWTVGPDGTARARLAQCSGGRGAGDEVSAGSVAPFTELSARRLGPVRRYLVRHPVVMDVLLVLVFAAWSLVTGVGADSTYVLHAAVGGERVAQMQVAAGVLTVAGSAALVWRRRRPVAVAVVMAALGVVALATTGAPAGFELGLALALYAVAAARPPSVAWAVGAGGVVALLVAAAALPLPQVVGARMLGVNPGDVDQIEAVTGGDRLGGFLRSAVWYQTAVPVLVLALAAVAAGTAVRNRRLHLAAFVEAANALARDQEQRARIAEAAERARIAREMHDVVAHSISVMVALGGGAAAAVDWAPARARTALDELVATGRSALADMRRVLGVLHDEPVRDTTVGTPDAPLEPQPGAPDLAALVERFRTAGLPVRTSGLTDPGLRALDAGRQLAVYRIVQESLTNTLRHAPATPSVAVDVRCGADGVAVVVTDGGGAGPAVPVGGSGRGLVGMRERTGVFGGSVEAGPHGRGWRVRAWLPGDGGDA